MNRPDHRFDHEWHVAINGFTNGKIGSPDWPGFMYEAKTMASEVPRMVLVLRQEREGKMEKLHKQCSISPTEPIQDNHLTCCLGVECRKCPHLLALEKAALTPEQQDEAKAWTCAAHIVSKGGDVMKEGYLLTTGDRMFWDNVYESLTQPEDAPIDTTGAKG